MSNQFQEKRSGFLGSPQKQPHGNEHSYGQNQQSIQKTQGQKPVSQNPYKPQNDQRGYNQNPQNRWYNQNQNPQGYNQTQQGNYNQPNRYNQNQNLRGYKSNQQGNYNQPNRYNQQNQNPQRYNQTQNPQRYNQTQNPQRYNQTQQGNYNQPRYIQNQQHGYNPYNPQGYTQNQQRQSTYVYGYGNGNMNQNKNNTTWYHEPQPQPYTDVKWGEQNQWNTLPNNQTDQQDKQDKQEQPEEKGKKKKSKKSKKNKKGTDQPIEKVKKKIDYTMWMVMTALCGLMGVLIYRMNMLSTKYMIAIYSMLACIALLFIILIIFRKTKTWRRYVNRTVMAVLSGILTFGNYTIWNGTDALTNITNAQSLMRVSIAKSSKADSAPEDIKDLEGKVVGYSVASDKSAVCYAMSKLNEKQAGIQYKAYKTYNDLYTGLASGEVVSAIIPNAREESLKSADKDFEKNVSYITTFTSMRNTKDQGTQKVVNLEKKEPFVVYLAGLGEAGDPTTDNLTDVNILLLIDPAKHSITTISIPRDAFVPNPALSMGSDKLTHLGTDGVYNSMEGIEQTFGIDIDYYARVSFTSVIALIDAIGGVTVDVEIPFTEQDENRSFAYNDLITLEAGKQKLNGKQALAYARHRKGYADGTAGRERAQQKIIKAMMNKLCSAKGMANINAVMDVAEQYVSTDIPAPLIQSIIKDELDNPQKWTVNGYTLDCVKGASLTTVSMPSLQLSCQLLSINDIKLVYTAYKAMKGEDSEKRTQEELQKQYKKFRKEYDEAVANGIEPNVAFYETLDDPTGNDYVVALEHELYIDKTQPVYGVENIQSESNEGANTRVHLTLPQLSNGYYSES